MRIGADASYLRFQGTGLARYLDGLLHAMADVLSDGDSLNVYYNSLPGPTLFEPAVRERFVRMPRPTAWNQLGVPAAVSLDRCDVYLGGANIIPVLGRFPKVLVVHDCMAFADPSAKPGSLGRYLRHWMRLSASHATTVVAQSRWTMEQCRLYLEVDADAITLIPPGVDARFHPEPSAPQEEARLRSDLGIAGPYILQVGGFERHKGGAILAQAVRVLNGGGRDLTLVRCGGAGPDQGRAGALDLGYVDEARLAMLYRYAAVVCVPSRYEGFGLPVVEAMASGTPVVASRGGALTETGGAAALYVDPGDVDGLGAAINRLLSEPQEWNRRKEAGIRNAARYTWEDAARKMLGLLVAASAKPRL